MEILQIELYKKIWLTVDLDIDVKIANKLLRYKNREQAFEQFAASVLLGECSSNLIGIKASNQLNEISHGIKELASEFRESKDGMSVYFEASKEVAKENMPVEKAEMSNLISGRLLVYLAQVLNVTVEVIIKSDKDIYNKVHVSMINDKLIIKCGPF